MNDLVWLSHFPKITYARQKKLIAHFLNSLPFCQIEFNDLCSIGFELEIAHELIVWRENNPWEKIKKQLEDNKITAITFFSESYPLLLKQITDPPWVLFVRGKLDNLNKLPALGIVGTRRCSSYGKETCEILSRDLSQKGVSIVSGLALGIDGVAHQTVLDNNGLTIAVLGSGIDDKTIYPREHKKLANDIIESGGTIISEYPPFAPPTQYTFPARNRIIAGLTQGTLVIEAPLKSGSLITASRALDYNREVMAIPHPMFSTIGAGNNELVKRGAALITTADEIVSLLNWC